MKGLIFTCLFMLIISLIYANCDFIAMLAKEGHQISDSEFEDEVDYFLQFLRTQSHQGLDNDGYGVIYYKNEEYTVPFEYVDPLPETNQAFYLWGEYDHSWYQHHGPSSGYYWNDSNTPDVTGYPDGPDYVWIPIFGTYVPFDDEDEAEGPFPIGFDFVFYGETYNEFIISPNGWIGFGDDWPHYTNYGLPREDAPKPAIFGFWDDLDPISGGNVYYEYQSAENRMIVWFDHVIRWNEQNSIFDFQIIIYSNGNIKTQYRTVTGTTNSATIGIQNASGTDGLLVVHNGNFTNDDSYVEDELAVLFSTEEYPEPLDIAEDRLMEPDNEAVIVLGHDRNRGQSSLNAAGQHPYRFELGGTTYTFQHNGNQYAKQEMIDYCLAIDPDWFDIDNHPLNWVFLGNDHNLVYTVGDTELLFHYFMTHVIEFNGDVIAGLISALNEQDLCGYNFRDSLYNEDDQVNIVLSDGKALYVFRNYSGYNLFYKEYDEPNEGFVAVRTRDPIPGGTPVQQYSLMEIPREGEIVTYENILTDAKAYSFDPTSEPGWTWLSFDILNTDSNENLAQNLLDPIKDEDYLDYALFKDHGNNTSVETIKYLGGGFWQNGNHPITSPYGYKFRTFDDCHLTVFGERCSENTTFYLAGEEEENWIGYFLLETQHVYDAFAGQLDNLTEIRAQHWAVKKGNGWPDVPYTLSPGDMIIVKCERDIPEFSWNFEEAREKYIVSGSQDFTFEEEADYIPVFISLDPEDLPSEIGAFVDGECKGATVVQDTSAQICTYILENQGQNLTFEFSYGSRGQNKRIDEYIIYDPETSKKEKGCIQIDTRRDCYYVSFKGNQNETPAVTSIEITNYPNPFNPDTKISFSLPEEQNIELIVYNLKGQKVKHLVSGQLSAGQHSVIWEGKNDNGKPVGSGLYFYKLRTEDKVLTKKMLLLK